MAFRDAHHHLLRDKDIITEHAALYLTQALRAFAVSLVGIFLPIFIFINSVDYLIFHEDKVINGIIWGFAYFFLRSVGSLISTTTLTKFIFAKLHLNRSLLIATGLQILEVYLWIESERNMYLMLLAGLIAGVKVTLFWIPYHTYFIKKFTSGKYGGNAGKRFLIEKALTGISPLLGGIIIANFGFDAAFYTSIALLIASSLPVFLTVHEWRHHEHTTTSILRGYMFNKKYLKMSLAYFGEAANAVVYTITWPILLFVGVASFVKIGALTSVTTVIAALASIVVGKALDKHGSRLIHAIGVFFNTILYIPRVFVTTPIALYTIDIMDRLNSPLFSLPNLALSYEKATRSKSSTDFIIYREITLHVGIAVISALLILILMKASVWRWLFFVAAAGSGIVYLMDLDSN